MEGGFPADHIGRVQLLLKLLDERLALLIPYRKMIVGFGQQNPKLLLRSLKIGCSDMELWLVR